jgi:radical SAM protein with 4Fe4S-binding SPASM domain
MMMGPTGDVFPCLMLGSDEWRLGNVREATPRDIWCGDRARTARRRIADSPICQRCTNNCDIVANLKEETWNFAGWLALHPSAFFALMRYVRQSDFARKMA